MIIGDYQRVKTVRRGTDKNSDNYNLIDRTALPTMAHTDSGDINIVKLGHLGDCCEHYTYTRPLGAGNGMLWMARSV